MRERAFHSSEKMRDFLLQCEFKYGDAPGMEASGPFRSTVQMLLLGMSEIRLLRTRI